MIDHIVVDVEIQHCVGEGGLTWDDTDQLGVAVACVWEYTGERMRVYGPSDVDALRARILRADRVSGFNTFNFDMPVIWNKSRPEWRDAGLPPQSAPLNTLSTCAELKQRLLPKSDDLLRRIWQALSLDPDTFSDAHKGWGLDNVARGTLGGPGKIGYGGDAPKWYQAGEWARVTNYCCDDVALERDLTTFVDRYGYVVNGATGRKVRVPAWEPEK